MHLQYKCLKKNPFVEKLCLTQKQRDNLTKLWLDV